MTRPSAAETFDDRVLDMLVECESALIETADIAKHCTEYNTRALIDQCRRIRRVAKRVHAILDKWQEARP
jgi:hypothetical protein